MGVALIVPEVSRNPVRKGGLDPQSDRTMRPVSAQVLRLIKSPITTRRGIYSLANWPWATSYLDDFAASI